MSKGNNVDEYIIQEVKDIETGRTWVQDNLGRIFNNFEEAELNYIQELKQKERDQKLKELGL